METQADESAPEPTLLEVIRGNRTSWDAKCAARGFDAREVILDEVLHSIEVRRPKAKPGKSKKAPAAELLAAVLAAGGGDKKTARDVLDAEGCAKYAAVLEGFRQEDIKLELQAEHQAAQRGGGARGMSARVNPDGSVQMEMFDADGECYGDTERAARVAALLDAARARRDGSPIESVDAGVGPSAGAADGRAE